ncbi:MAG: hypothetical protein AB1651_05825 [Pseudomonadota bacterium]
MTLHTAGSYRPLLLAAAALALVTASAAALAGERERSITRVGPHGRSLDSQSQVLREPGYRSATRSIEGGSGRGLTREAERVIDLETGTASRAVTTTTNGGQSWGHSQSATVNDSGGLDRSATYTGPAGASASRDSSSGHGDGSAWRSSTLTGPNGGSVDVDRSVTVTPATP